MKEELTIQRPDGRTVGYAEYGDPGGVPVVCFHGTPGSRLIARVFDDWAREAACRLIATDRPGYGLSSPQPGRTFFDHADDVAAIGDELGFDRFAVVGISGGSPYVFASASGYPDRVTAGAVVSGWYGLDPPVDIGDLGDEQAASWRERRADPETARPSLDQSAAMVGAIESQDLMRQQLASSPEWVRALIESTPSIARAYVDHHLEGLRQGSDGGVQEIGMQARPWGIDFSTIPVEIRLWHGGLDGVPRSHVDAVAAALKQSAVSWHPDLGHIDCCFLMPEILQWLSSVR